jgi:uncharacterized protein
MLEVIEKLLILQDRDRRIKETQAELATIEPQRQAARARDAGAQAALDAAKTRGNQIESERKRLELEVEGKKQLIEKYANQQFQTRKNEEYRALAHEIEMCREGILKLEDQQLELMEQGEAAARELQKAKLAATEAKKEIEALLAALDERETIIKRELDELGSNRDDLAAAVEEGALARYERLFNHKGGRVVVGIEHGVCGGCHMKLPVQTLVTCQAQAEIVTCNNCSRILYYSREMDLAVAE